MIATEWKYLIENHLIFLTTRSTKEQYGLVMKFLKDHEEEFENYKQRLLCVNTADKGSFEKMFDLIELVEKIDTASNIATHGVLLYKRPEPDLHEAYNALRIACTAEYKGSPILVMSEVPLAGFIGPILSDINFSGVRGNAPIQQDLKNLLIKKPEIIMYDAKSQMII